MKKITKYVLLLMTALVITTAAVSCSKDSENESDPTPSPVPDDPSNPGNSGSNTKSILGYWRYQYITPTFEEIYVYNMREDGLLYLYSYDRDYSQTDKDIDIDRYYYDEANGYWVYYCSYDSEQMGEWSWDLFKVTTFDNNSLVMTFLVDEDDGPHLTGPFDVKGCKQIIDIYKALDIPDDGGDILRLTRISEKEFSDWWNSLSD